jgi:hypothetical protein
MVKLESKLDVFKTTGKIQEVVCKIYEEKNDLKSFTENNNKNILSEFFITKIKESKLHVKCSGNGDKRTYIFTPNSFFTNTKEKTKTNFLDFSFKKYFDENPEDVFTAILFFILSLILRKFLVLMTNLIVNKNFNSNKTNSVNNQT